jgi:hypothetical protein
VSWHCIRVWDVDGERYFNELDLCGALTEAAMNAERAGTHDVQKAYESVIDVLSNMPMRQIRPPDG